MDTRAVVFDIDGTMYPNWRMYVISLPFAVMNVRLLRHFAAARRTIRTLPTPVDVHAVQSEMVARNLRVSREKARELIDRKIYSSWERLLRHVRLFPQIETVVDQLRADGYALGVLSDFPTNQKLDLLGLGGRWDVVLSSEEVGALKPDPAPFLEIAERLGMAPAEVLYVGNNYRYDVIGAKRAGMKAAHLASRPPKDTIADVSFDRFTGLLEWIRNNDD